jgi:actin-related protein 6
MSPIRIRPEEQGDEEEVLAEAKRDEEGNWEKDTYEEAKSGEGLERIGSEQWVKKMEDTEVAEPVIWRLERELRVPEKVTNIDQLRWFFIEAFSPYYKGKWDDSEHLEAARLAAQEKEKLGKKPRTPKIVQSTGAEEADLVFEEAPSAPQETSTAPIVGGALVKQAEGKPFDFMSNRPVPRAKPVEAASTPEAIVEQVTPAAEAKLAEEPILAQKPISLDIESAAETARRAIADARHEVLGMRIQRTADAIADARHEVFAVRTQRTADAIARLRQEVHGKGIKPTKKSDKKVISTLPKPTLRKWRDLPLTDPTIKLKIYKTLVASTNHLISDTNLHSSHTLGDLYGHLIAASKPKPTKLYQQIKLEAALHPNKKSPGMEQLTKLSNVTLHKKKITEKQQERKLGRWKVIEYALTERDLPLTRPRGRKADYWLAKA